MASTTNNHKIFSKASSSSHTTARETSISARKRGRNYNMKTSPQISRSPDDNDQVSRPTENTFERIMSKIIIIRDRLSPYLHNSLIGSVTAGSSSIFNTGSYSISNLTVYMALVFGLIVMMISRTTRKQLRQAFLRIVFKIVPILKAATSIKDI